MIRSKLSEKFELFVFNLDAGDLVENFFIAGISSILIVRTFLYLTGYPQIGGSGYHIAHMLWGGLLMAFALLLLLSFLSKEAKETAAVIGGIGFGLFIDELGKFITRDNNYFFEPTISLIYFVFVTLFLISRIAEHKIRPTSKVYAINGLEITKEALLFDLDTTEKRKALRYLKKAEKDNTFIRQLVRLIEKMEPQKGTDSNIFGQVKAYIEEKYFLLSQNRLFAKVLIIIFLAVSVVHFTPIVLGYQPLDSYWTTAELVSSVISLTLVIIGGAIFLHGKRYLAFELFKYAALVSIFITQFFLFYQNQLSAVFYLFISLTMYITTRFLLSQEKVKKEDKGIIGRLSSLFSVSE